MTRLHTRAGRWIAAASLTLLGALTAHAAGLPIRYDFNTFAGAGWAAEPAAGQLDADDWRITGLSEGDLDFGQAGTSGDFARGLSPGGVGTGGIYAFDTGGGDIALGVQPTGTDFSPGAFTLRLRNESGTDLQTVDVRYKIHTFNDQNRATTIELAFSTDDINYFPVPQVAFTTPAAAAAEPAWGTVTLTAALDAPLPEGELLFLRWSAVDAGGSGSRDEFALDDIEVGPQSPTAVALRQVSGRAAGPAGALAFSLPAAALLLASTVVLWRRKRRPSFREDFLWLLD